VLRVALLLLCFSEVKFEVSVCFGNSCSILCVRSSASRQQLEEHGLVLAIQAAHLAALEAKQLQRQARDTGNQDVVSDGMDWMRPTVS
jgi:hypothetical protein